MRLTQISLPCGARLTAEQDDSGYSFWAGSVRYRLDELPVTRAEAQALLAPGGRYWGGMQVWHAYHGEMVIGGLELTRDEAQAIADGGDPLTVLGAGPARVVLSIVRLPWDG